MSTKTDLDLILVKASGTAILTLALIRLPEVFRGIIQLTVAFSYKAVSSDDQAVSDVVMKLNQSFISSAIGDVAAFVVLLLLAKWMFGYPRVMKLAFNRADCAKFKPEAGD